MAMGSVATKVKVLNDGYKVELEPVKASLAKECAGIFRSPAILSQIPGAISSIAKVVNSPKLGALANNVHVVKNVKMLETFTEQAGMIEAPFKLYGIGAGLIGEYKGGKGSKISLVNKVASATGVVLGAVKSAEKHLSGVSVPENAKPFLDALKQSATVVESFTSLLKSTPKLYTEYNSLSNTAHFTLSLRILIVKTIAATAAMIGAISKLAEMKGVSSSRPLVLKGLQVIGALGKLTSIAIRVLESHEKKVEAAKASGSYVKLENESKEDEVSEGSNESFNSQGDV